MERNATLIDKVSEMFGNMTNTQAIILGSVGGAISIFFALAIGCVVCISIWDGAASLLPTTKKKRKKRRDQEKIPCAVVVDAE